MEALERTLPVLKEFTATYAHIEASVHIELLAPFIGPIGAGAPCA